MERNAPATEIATAIPATTGATLLVPTASVVAVSLAVVMGTCATTGAAIAVTRTIGDGES